MKGKGGFLGLSGVGFMMRFISDDAFCYWIGAALAAAYPFLESVFSGQLFALVARLTNPETDVWGNVLFVLGFLIFIILVTGVGEILFTKAVASSDFLLRKELGQRMARIPLFAWYQKHSGECMSVFGKDTDAASEVYKDRIPFLMGLILQTVGGLIVLVVVCPLYAGYALIWGFCYLWIGMANHRRWRAHSKNQRQAAADSAATLGDLLGGFAVIRMYSAIRRNLLYKYRQEVETSFQAGRQIVKLSTKTQALFQLGYTLSNTGTFFVGILLVYSGRIALTNMLALWPVAMGLAFAVMELGFFVTETQPVMAATDRVRGLFETPREEGGACEQIGCNEPLISFHNVDFSYQDGVFALKGCNFCVHQGEKVALVGESGSGKSTVVKLMMNLYQADAGEIRFGGRPVQQYGLPVLRGQFAYVPQSPHILSDALLENIVIVAEDEPRERAIRAAQEACVNEFAQTLSEGYDTKVTETTLSGGQKQRVGIARALLKSAQVLVFDEMTAALDGQTEADIYRSIGQRADGRTMIMITHRLAAATAADRILVFEGGKVAEEGTHHELLAQNGLYAKLWAMQAS